MGHALEALAHCHKDDPGSLADCRRHPMPGMRAGRLLGPPATLCVSDTQIMLQLEQPVVRRQVRDHGDCLLVCGALQNCFLKMRPHPGFPGHGLIMRRARPPHIGQLLDLRERSIAARTT
jgi:hypothetical protein